MSSDQQQSLNSLLQWSIENSSNTASQDQQQPNNASTQSQPRDPARGLNSKMLAELLGGPSDADRMREAMTAILAPRDQVDLENKSIAWDNLEQLIENIDNANNMQSLGIWPPLLLQLDDAEPEMRRMAAWCAGTAVQNNVTSQEFLLAHGGIKRLAKVAVEDLVLGVRKKAISALSSAVRNFQPGLDELEGGALPEDVWKRKAQGLDAADMDQVDLIIQALRNRSAARG